MKYSTFQIELQVPQSEDGYLFDVGSLYERLLTLTDKRKARGKQYTLVLILLLMVLAKLGGEDNPCGIADWARARRPLLAQMLQLNRDKLPGHPTYRRALGQVVDLGVSRKIIIPKSQAQHGLTAILGGFWAWLTISLTLFHTHLIIGPHPNLSGVAQWPNAAPCPLKTALL
jgi:hypothetical protein